MLLPIPINLDTVNRLYGLTSPRTSSRAGSPRAPSRSPRSAPPRTSSCRKVGRELYEKFFRGYTRKQWGARPVGARQVGDRARADAHQPRRPLLRRRVPVHAEHGYTRMFERMLDHPNINIMLQTDYDDVKRHRPASARDLHRSDRRVLRLPLRQAALPLAALPARHARPGMAPAGRRGELPADRTTTRGSPSTST